MHQTAIARAIAHIAHRKQKYGKASYTYHVGGVAKLVHDQTIGDDTLVAAAWLHDVLEDTDITSQELADAGVSMHVIAIVQLLTRRLKEPYANYITSRVATHRGAVKIKLADLEFNLAHNPKQSNVPKYQWAQQFLNAVLIAQVKAFNEFLRTK